ncbi:MAG: folate-binding protein YgfZ [Proteobacteria bacterium]|nr:folate-binding protein YgfZ [Pseudomonadota bacterium]
MTRIANLDHRAVLSVEGDDRVSFLQGLVSQDMERAAPGQALWTALLTPQGKWLAEFFVFSDGGRLLLEVEAAQREMIATRLTRFRLRARVTITPSPLAVQTAWDGPVPEVPLGLVAADPRLETAGWRILSERPLPTNASAADWDAHRLALGLPDGTRDLEPEKTVLLEAGFDELNGISWTKGCYMGQELTARTRYRGLVKRRLVPVAITGEAPTPGTPVMSGGREVGTMRSASGGRGLAVLRLDALQSEALTCGAATLIPAVPGWMRLPPAASTALAQGEAIAQDL